MKAEFEQRQKEGPMAMLSGGGGGGGSGGSQPNPLGDFDMAAYLAGSGKKDKNGGGGGGSGGSKNQGVKR